LMCWGALSLLLLPAETNSPTDQHCCCVLVASAV
jgi:hypothetical protein